jgi:hypothetical protein
VEQRQLAVSAAHAYFLHAKQDLIVLGDRRSADVSLDQQTLLEIQRDSAH